MKNRCIDVLKRVDVYKAMHSESNNKRLKTKQTKKSARESYTDPKKQRKRKKLCPVPYGTRIKYSKNITSFYLFFLKLSMSPVLFIYSGTLFHNSAMGVLTYVFFME